MKKSDIDSAIAICSMANDGTSTGNVAEDVPLDELNENSGNCKISAYYLLVMYWCEVGFSFQRNNHASCYSDIIYADI